MLSRVLIVIASLLASASACKGPDGNSILHPGETIQILGPNRNLACPNVQVSWGNDSYQIPIIQLQGSNLTCLEEPFQEITAPYITNFTGEVKLRYLCGVEDDDPCLKFTMTTPRVPRLNPGGLNQSFAITQQCNVTIPPSGDNDSSTVTTSGASARITTDTAAITSTAKTSTTKTSTTITSTIGNPPMTTAIMGNGGDASDPYMSGTGTGTNGVGTNALNSTQGTSTTTAPAIMTNTGVPGTGGVPTTDTEPPCTCAPQQGGN